MVSASVDRLKSERGPNLASAEKLITLAFATVIVLASIVLMLSRTSPEFSWDEADYVAKISNSWGFLWGLFTYNRHGHGPLAMDLAKLGQQVLPVWAGSLEQRLRFFETLVSSLGVGFVYWTLRLHFRTSRAAALVGSSLLLFSAIRLEETNIVGPHDLMLACAIGIAALGCHWRNEPTWQHALGLGALMGFGALSMTYVIPAALCWAAAVGLTGTGWFTWDRTYFQISWAVLAMLMTAAIIVAALWPPGVFHMAVIQDFWYYLHYPSHPTLVGDRIFEVTPRWASVYWLARLDAPILVFSVLIVLVALWKAFKNDSISSKHAYLVIFLGFFLVTALAAHMAGARNLLQFIGVLCLAVGALFDEALGRGARILRPVAAFVVIMLAAVNLIWLSRSFTYTPFFATDGYRRFLKENSNRLREPASALVYGVPVLKFYADKSGEPIDWSLREVPWTTSGKVLVAPDVKYVLMPAFVYNNMPAGQPMRRIVADHWNVVWSYRIAHVWELRLYENPQPASP